MEKKKFNLANNIVATVILVISAFVYLSTIEPTASFWDCGEFIASSYKLEVGHPPGNPVFQLFARFFTLFTDNMHAAAAVNCCSALCSAFTIFFLYLTIVHFGRRILESEKKNLSVGNVVALLGAGVAGSLAYCFSDTFWFSAVEGEVYAMSSLFTAMVFWAILKWEEEADAKYANRWIILISLLMGLSIGVHLLNLLAIPPIVFIYYYKKHEHVTFKQNLFVLILSGIILAVVLFGIIPYIPKIMAVVDRIFVNGFNAPFDVGATIFMVLLFAACFYTLHILRKKGKAVWHTILLCFTTILIGYSVFAIVLIRASANTPTNEHQPDNPYTLIRYLSREQYGSHPVLYGQSYVSVYEAESNKYYTPLGKKYYHAPAPYSAVYPSGAEMFFPRMWSNSSAQDINFYNSYTDNMFRIKKVTMPISKEDRMTKMPYFKDNLTFFFDYQLNYMYFRYFMWNFVGRQNDLHGQVPGDRIRGNWESGIKFIDNARLGDQSVGPDYIVHNRAKNHYYFLPLILGLIGFFFQLKKDGRNCWITTLFFFLTGIAIIVYLNQTPYQVRERDYAYAGSFYVFTIWIGLAVLAIKNWLDKGFEKTKLSSPLANAGIASTLCIAVAILMGCENWDDHDRSNRYTARDMAYNYLMSCDHNAILLTHGDNDTFPLWYAQEVENIRTDVRIMNTSLLGMDWYIDQMKLKVYDSDPLPISIDRKDYLYGTNDFVPVLDVLHRPLTAKEVMDIFTDPQYRSKDCEGLIATHDILLPVDKENVKKYHIVAEKDYDSIVDTIKLNISGKTLGKTDLIVLNMLSNYKWDRPIYFVSAGGDVDLGLKSWLQYDGMCYKLVPLVCPTSRNEIKKMDADNLYDRLMHVYRFDSNMDTTVHVDYQNLYTFTAVSPIREMFTRTAEALLAEGKTKEAVTLLDRCLEVTPKHNYPYNVSNLRGMNELLMIQMVELYIKASEPKKALKIAHEYLTESVAAIRYFGQPFKGGVLSVEDVQQNLSYMYYLATVLKEGGFTDFSDSIMKTIALVAKDFK